MAHTSKQQNDVHKLHFAIQAEPCYLEEQGMTGQSQFANNQQELCMQVKVSHHGAR